MTGKRLKEVTVVSKSPLIRQEAGKVIYDLQADPQSKVSSVLDMMRKVPYLSVDGDDNILLNGSPGYKVFINGRPSGLVQRNPKDVLRSIAASTIKSIEVITNPPAKYEAEGLAGIINIVTARQTSDGFKSTINASEKSPVGGPGAGCSFTLKQARIGMSALVGSHRYNIPETGSELKQSTAGLHPTELEQAATNQSNSHTIYGGLELSCEIDSLNLVSGEFTHHTNRQEGLMVQNSSLTGSNLPQYYRLNNDNSNEDNRSDASLNYQRGFKANKNQLLTFSYRYYKDKASLYNDIVFFNKINYSIPDYQQYNSEVHTEHTVQVDYVHPFNQLSVECGIKGISRTNESDFQYSNLNTATGKYETDPVRSNIFNYNQQILAAYNSYAYESGPWQFKGGVRAEETIIKIGYSQGAMPLERQYLNVLPSILASRKFNNSNSLSFSFSTRVQRPSGTELNPFVDRSNPYAQTSGNPYLLPITSNVYQLSYLRAAKITLNVSLGAMFFNNVFNAIPVYNAATGITLARNENYGKGRVLKTNISLSYPVTANWNFTMNSDIRHVWVYGVTNNGLSVENSGMNVYVYASTGYSFKKALRVNADITYNMGGISLPLGRTNGFVASSFSLNKDIVQSKLSLSAAVNNPFTKYRYANETITGPDFLQTSVRQSYYRRYTISLNCRFGKLKEEIKKNKRGITNDDTGN